VSNTYDDSYYFNIFHINHAVAPYNTLNRGYIVTVDGTLTTGGFDTSMFYAVNNCRDPWYLLSCDDDTNHLISGPAGYGSKIVTGRVPPGWWAGIVVTAYNRGWVCGNYTMRIEFDEDGDGVADVSDGSNALMRGASTALGGEGGVKELPRWPWADHGYSYNYPDPGLGGGGRDVYYHFTNTFMRNLTVRVYPRIRGDVYGGAPSFLADGRVWAWTPVSLWAYCRGSGWFTTPAGGWVGCDRYGDGEWEQVYLENAPAGSYYFAYDTWTSVPQGSWYTIEFNP
jgi:hypothetical protein